MAMNRFGVFPALQPFNPVNLFNNRMTTIVYTFSTFNLFFTKKIDIN